MNKASAPALVPSIGLPSVLHSALEYPRLPISSYNCSNLTCDGQDKDTKKLNLPTFKWRLVIAYDGTRFSGWQYQQSTPTVQCIIEEALTRITKLERKDLLLVGAGRTDAGVHAWGQVAHFITPFNYDSLEGIHKALNGLLPSDIRVREISSAVPEFHARFSVKSKIYHYKIYNDTVMDPFHREYAYHSVHKLNVAAMSDAAKHFVGQHDFSAFANASRNDRVPNPVKKIFHFNVNEMVLVSSKKVLSLVLYQQIKTICKLLPIRCVPVVVLELKSEKPHPLSWSLSEISILSYVFFKYILGETTQEMLGKSLGTST